MHTALNACTANSLPDVEATTMYSARTTMRTSCVCCFQEVFEETKALLRDQSEKEFCQIR